MPGENYYGMDKLIFCTKYLDFCPGIFFMTYILQSYNPCIKNIILQIQYDSEANTLIEKLNFIREGKGERYG